MPIIRIHSDEYGGHYGYLEQPEAADTRVRGSPARTAVIGHND